jgi:hypothetical protein
MSPSFLNGRHSNQNGVNMKPNGKHLDPFRKAHPNLGPSPKGSLFGFFMMLPLAPSKHFMTVISSGEHRDGPFGDWEHVSVSLQDRCPTWDEMCKVKDLFWRPDETVLQFHPRESEYVNNHQYCLHLWKPKTEVQLPPNMCI